MANGGGVQLYEQRFRQPEDRNVKEGAMGSVDIYNITSSTSKTKFQPSSKQTGCLPIGGNEGKHFYLIQLVSEEKFPYFSLGYFHGRKHNGRAGTAYSNIVSVRKRISSEEEELHSLPTNSSVKGAPSKIFVPRSRRIQSAGSAEEEIMKANEVRNRCASLDGKPLETTCSRSVLQSTTSVVVDAVKVQHPDVGTGSYSGEEGKSRETKNTCIPRQERKPSYMSEPKLSWLVY